MRFLQKDKKSHKKISQDIGKCDKEVPEKKKTFKDMEQNKNSYLE